jgi:hypothetical protein
VPLLLLASEHALRAVHSRSTVNDTKVTAVMRARTGSPARHAVRTVLAFLHVPRPVPEIGDAVEVGADVWRRAEHVTSASAEVVAVGIGWGAAQRRLGRGWRPGRLGWANGRRLRRGDGGRWAGGHRLRRGDGGRWAGGRRLRRSGGGRRVDRGPRDRRGRRQGWDHRRPCGRRRWWAGRVRRRCRTKDCGRQGASGTDPYQAEEQSGGRGRPTGNPEAGQRPAQ